jgi:hypothetical protein
VEKIDDVVQQLKAGDLKLRVRALELERAARRSSILQVRLPMMAILLPLRWHIDVEESC